MNDEMKFKCSDVEHCKLIQHALFDAGYEWGSSGKNLFNVGANCLYAKVNGRGQKRISHGTDVTYFTEHEYPEYKLSFGALVPVNTPEPVVTEPAKDQPKPRLRPRQEAYQERLVEILEAMVWAAKQGVVIPDDWDDEYDALRESLNDVYDPQGLVHISIGPNGQLLADGKAI